MGENGFFDIAMQRYGIKSVFETLPLNPMILNHLLLMPAPQSTQA